jgi:hypothetical protein
MVGPATVSDLTPVWVVAGVFMVIFLIVRLGLIKSWFILKTLPGLLSARMFYAMLPLSLFFVGLGISALFPYENVDKGAQAVIFASFPLLVLMFLFMIWPPRFIQPGWLRWLEREYGYCLDILVKEGQKMDRWEWEDRVRTRAGMQAWIDEVFARRRAEIDQRWVATRTELLFAEAESRGSHVIEFGARIESHVPQHRQQEEEERVHAGLQKLEEIRKRERKG